MVKPHVCLPLPLRFDARSAKMPQADEGPIEPPLQPKGPVVDQAGVDPGSVSYLYLEVPAGKLTVCY